MSEYYKEIDGGASVIACEEMPADRWHVRDPARPGVHVSTLFLGINQSDGVAFGFEPVLYETMIFGGPLNGSQWRYTDRCAAEAGHKQAVASATKAGA